MPYKIERSGKMFKVTHKGHVFGTHPSKQAAEQQIKAIYANEMKGKK